MKVSNKNVTGVSVGVCVFITNDIVFWLIFINMNGWCEHVQLTWIASRVAHHRLHICLCATLKFYTESQNSPNFDHNSVTDVPPSALTHTTLRTKSSRTEWGKAEHRERNTQGNPVICHIINSISLPVIHSQFWVQSNPKEEKERKKKKKKEKKKRKKEHIYQYQNKQKCHLHHLHPETEYTTTHFHYTITRHRITYLDYESIHQWYSGTM